MRNRSAIVAAALSRYLPVCVHGIVERFATRLPSAATAALNSPVFPI
jgi:hypothetical protein